TTNRDLLPGTPVSTRTGLPPASLDQLAGRNMTMEVYAEASEEEVRAALGKLSEAMGGSQTDS
ncbi:hypothetical protein AB0N07_12310, partial [Streptomyces sp. NPDC051172]